MRLVPSSTMTSLHRGRKRTTLHIQTRARAREVWGLLQCAVEHIQEDSCATSAFGCRQEVDFSRHCRQGLQAKNLTRSVAPEVIVIDCNI